MKTVRLELAAMALLAWMATSVANAHVEPEGFYYAYRTTQAMEAGRAYTIETYNLRARDSLQMYPAATYILVIDPDGTGESGRLVAHGGVYDNTLRSRIRFTPTVSKSYRIIVTSNNVAIPFFPATLGSHLQCGRADFRIRDESTGVTRLAPGISFCGQSHFVRHHAGECFRATGHTSSTDPYLIFVRTTGRTDIATGAEVIWNQDNGANGSWVCFDDHGSGWVLAFADSISGEGPGEVSLVAHTRVETGDQQPILSQQTNLPVSSLFRISVELRANMPYMIQTADLRKRDFLQGPAVDTVMYVIDPQTNTVIARNDDWYPGSPLSHVVLTVPETKVYQVLVRARHRSTPGTMDLLVNGAVVANDRHFAGEVLRPMLKAGLIDGAEDCITTELNSGNPYIAWFPHPSSQSDTGGRVILDDNGGEGTNARVCFSDFARLYPGSSTAFGILVLGSSTTASEGAARLRIDGSTHVASIAK